MFALVSLIVSAMPGRFPAHGSVGRMVAVGFWTRAHFDVYFFCFSKVKIENPRLTGFTGALGWVCEWTRAPTAVGSMVGWLQQQLPQLNDADIAAWDIANTASFPQPIRDLVVSVINALRTKLGL